MEIWQFQGKNDDTAKHQMQPKKLLAQIKSAYVEQAGKKHTAAA